MVYGVALKMNLSSFRMYNIYVMQGRDWLSTHRVIPVIYYQGLNGNFILLYENFGFNSHDFKF